MTQQSTDRQVGWAVLAILGVVVVLPAFAMTFGMMGVGPLMDGPWHHGMWGTTEGVSGWMLAVGLGMQLLSLAVLLGAAYLGLRALTSAGGSSNPALEELRTAYARGDLDDAEFERRRDRLEPDH
ncbi:MAG: SHOCT domain-containing protein [Halobacteriaceae archaeon]